MELSINEPWITSKVRCQDGYVYIDKPFWNQSKKRADHKREYIGKFDGVGFTPNKTFLRLKTEYEKRLVNHKTGPKPTDACLRQFYGSTYLLNEICEKTGIVADLGRCFGDLAPQLLSIAYYLILEAGQPLYRFRKWNITHRHPYGKDITSQRSCSTHLGADNKNVDSIDHSS